MFTFVTDGIESALEQARKVAGDKIISISGGKTIQAYLKADLVDEILIHIVPILLGGGVSLFGAFGKYVELEKIDVTDKKAVTHLAYRVKRTQ